MTDDTPTPEEALNPIIQQINSRKLEQAKRRAQMLEYRRLGFQNEAIGKKMGIAPSTVSRLIKKALADAGGRSDAKELRTLEIMRIEAIIKYLTPRAMPGPKAKNQEYDKDAMRQLIAANKLLSEIGGVTGLPQEVTNNVQILNMSESEAMFLRDWMARGRSLYGETVRAGTPAALEPPSVYQQESAELDAETRG